jgi:hypothetical protein
MRVAFVYNAQDHQVLHSLPIACRLSQIEEACDVTVFAGTDDQASLCRELAAVYPRHRLRFETLRAPPLMAWLKGRIATPKLLILWTNRARLGGFDALVVPERTTLFLKKMGARHPKFVHTSHGGGGHDKADDPRLREFDLLLAPNADRLRRIAAAGNLRPGAAAVIGYVKFDLVRRLAEQRPALFANDRPTILYNPHHRADTSSWPAMGMAVLDHFANQDRYNLIFAPHVRLFDPPARHLPAFDRYRGIDNIHIDLGSACSIDMSYTLAADIYLGDVSSQVLEFLIQPRPCIFLDPRRLAAPDDPDFPYWQLGPVVHDVAGLEEALATRETWLPNYLPAQRHAFDAAFPALDEPAPERAARAIAAFLRDGRLPDDLAAS